ncbi:MAG: hypothetical protein ACO1NM_04750 [Sphingobium phenoxybenzoativorans]
MRAFYSLIPCLLVTASCGQAPSREESVSAPAAVTDVATKEGGPGISPTAAPGVAFNYAYQFRLPAIRIAQVQEQHAQACEKLGITKCRISGMRYKVLGESEIEAYLAFKLAPEIARNFGKSGIAAVEKAEGMVVDTEISGTDVSSAIATAKRNTDEISDQIAALEAQLAAGGLKADTRAQLNARIDELRSNRRANVESRDENEDALANTPMVFSYGSGTLIPGFDARSPIRDALQTGANILIGMLSFLIVAISFLVPATLIAGALLYIFRKLKPIWKRWAGSTGTADAS